MALLTDLWLVDISIFAVFLLICLYLYFKIIIYTYWRRYGIAQLNPTFPFGDIKDIILFRKPIGVAHLEIYNQFKGEKIGGIFQLHLPTLIIRHPETIKQLLVKDFNCFRDRGTYYDEVNDPLMGNLFFMHGENWKNMRAKLTPTFTSGKMKMMFLSVLECGLELNQCLLNYAEKEETIEINEIAARFTTDVIAICAFGIQCNCLKDPDAEFRQRGREFFKRSFWNQVGFFFQFFVPTLAKITKLSNLPKKLNDFFTNMLVETVENREKSNLKRNDFVDLLIQLKNKGFVEDDENDGEAKHSGGEKGDTKTFKNMGELAAQAFVFFIAGFETASTTMSFCLYELALNPDIQRRVAQEIDTVAAAHNGQITYEGVQEMEYLDMVVSETLRKYPPLPMLNRECNTPYKLESGCVIEPGVKVIVPVYALHHDPEYYPEPQRFDPERFTKEEKQNRNPYTYMPFGEGPRNCIAMRFGLMQTKVGLVSLLRSYEFRVSAETVVPLVLDPALLILGSVDGVHLQVVKRIRFA